MNHSHNLPLFKNLLRHSWHFYKANWKFLVLIFLPVLFFILLLTLILRFGFSSAGVWVSALVTICGIVLALTKVFKQILLFSGGMIAFDIENGENKKIHLPYKKIALQVWPIIWVSALQFLFLFVFSIIVFIAAGIVLLAPFLLITAIVRADPSTISFFTLYGNTITVVMLTVSLFGFILANIFFLSGIWFSSYALLLDKRTGLDAIATSLTLTRGRRWQIFWRMIVIGLIALVPILIILGPVYIQILSEIIPKLLISLLLYVQFNIIAPWPEISSMLFTWRTVLASIAYLISMPIFIVLNYFLWKDVKATAPVFEETTYIKTRKRAKIIISIGFLLSLIFALASVF